MLMATLKHRQSGFNSHADCAAFAARDYCHDPPTTKRLPPRCGELYPMIRRMHRVALIAKYHSVESRIASTNDRHDQQSLCGRQSLHFKLALPHANHSTAGLLFDAHFSVVL